MSMSNSVDIQCDLRVDGPRDVVYGKQKSNPRRRYRHKFDANYLPCEPGKLDGLLGKQVIFNTVYEYPNPDRPIGRKEEKVDKIWLTNPYTPEAFGEDLYGALIGFYRDENGFGNVPAEHVQYFMYEMKCYQDWLALNEDTSLLDFLNHAKTKEVNEFILKYVSNDGRRHNKGNEDFADFQQRCMKRELNKAYSIVNTARLLDISKEAAETGHVYIGVITNQTRGILKRAELTKRRKYWQFISDQDVERLTALGYREAVKELPFHTRHDVGVYVHNDIQKAFRLMDLEHSWHTKFKNISPHLVPDIIAAHYVEERKRLFGKKPELTLGQPKPQVKDDIDVEIEEKELVAV